MKPTPLMRISRPVACVLYVLILVLYVCVASTADAQTGRTLHLPPASRSLQLAHAERTHGVFARFGGRYELGATLVAKWIPEDGDEVPAALDIHLEPDPAAAAVLPHFDAFEVRTVQLDNGPAVLRMALRPRTVERLQRRQLAQVRVTGRFLLEQYSVGVECDSPWARARVVRVRGLGRPELLAEEGSQSC